MVAIFIRALRARRRSEPPTRWPKTAVVLCLRGPDPFLAATIRALLDQDYPDYDVKVVVDSRDDPAWSIVEQTLAETGASNVEIQTLAHRRDTCSLKCSSLLQAVGSLDPAYEVVALVDADTIPHRTWLRDLVAPLADPRVGVATGNRWYMPDRITWGSMVRYIWNSAAVVQMYWYRIPWGGTLAIKTAALRKFDLDGHWGRAFCEDTMLFRVMRDVGLEVAFVPSLMMVNREGASLGGFFGWVSRQLLTARLYHPGWSLVLLHGVATSAILTFAAGLTATSAALGAWNAALWTAAGLGAYLAAMPLLILAMELAVRGIVHRRDEPTHWMGPRGVLGVALGVSLTQIVYLGALLSAISSRMVRWRGVTYKVDGPWNIRLVEDRPYRSAERPQDAMASL